MFDRQKSRANTTGTCIHGITKAMTEVVGPNQLPLAVNIWRGRIGFGPQKTMMQSMLPLEMAMFLGFFSNFLGYAVDFHALPPLDLDGHGVR